MGMVIKKKVPDALPEVQVAKAVVETGGASAPPTKPISKGSMLKKVGTVQPAIAGIDPHSPDAAKLAKSLAQAKDEAKAEMTSEKAAIHGGTIVKVTPSTHEQKTPVKSVPSVAAGEKPTLPLHDPLAEVPIPAPGKSKTVPAVAVVSKQFSDGSETQDHEQVGIATFTGPVALVEVSMGVTRSIGKFESVKLHVGLTLPCNPTAEDIDATYHEAKGWVDARVEAINQEITDELGK